MNNFYWGKGGSFGAHLCREKFNSFNYNLKIKKKYIYIYIYWKKYLWRRESHLSFCSGELPWKKMGDKIKPHKILISNKLRLSIQTKYQQPVVIDVGVHNCNPGMIVFWRTLKWKCPLGRTTQLSVVLLKPLGQIQDRPTFLLYGSFTSGIQRVESVLDLGSKHLVSKIYARYIIMGKSLNIAKLRFPHL